MTRPITTAPADTARAMHAAEMRGQDMQDAPERDGSEPPTWANIKAAQNTRTDLCITEAECQHRIDAAVHKLINALMWIDNRCPSGLALCGRDHPNQTHANAMYDAGECARAAIRARGQK